MAKGPSGTRNRHAQQTPSTKVFSLVGKVRNTGLVEMPLGSALKTSFTNRRGALAIPEIKAVQTGGPSGGCILRQLFHSPVEYESLAALGAIHGFGRANGVMDEDN